jgi:hypothetical protein
MENKPKPKPPPEGSKTKNVESHWNKPLINNEQLKKLLLRIENEQKDK